MPKIFEGNLTAPDGKFALCVSRFNAFITEELLKGALDALRRHGVQDDDVEVFWTPGAFDLSALVNRVARSGKYVAVVALGAVIRGGTPHFDYVSSEVAKGVGEAARTSDCAVSFGVLTTDSVEQAIDRAGTKAGNKGADAAMAALEMANLYAGLSNRKGKGK